VGPPDDLSRTLRELQREWSNGRVSNSTDFLRVRIHIDSVLIVLSFVSALVFGVLLILLLDRGLSEESGVWRVFTWIGAPVIVYAIFLSGSRNAPMSVGIGVSLFVLAREVQRRRQFCLGSAALVGAFLVVVTELAVHEDMRELVLPRGDSAASRVPKGSLRFGLGINTDVMIDGIEFLHPHNLYLSLTRQWGVIALLLFGTLLTTTAAKLYVHFHCHDAKLAIGILGLALPSHLLDGYQLIDKVGSTWLLLWLPIVCVGICFGGTQPQASRGPISVTNFFEET
jgi:hypothetical protein